MLDDGDQFMSFKFSDKVNFELGHQRVSASDCLLGLHSHPSFKNKIKERILEDKKGVAFQTPNSRKMKNKKVM